MPSISAQFSLLTLHLEVAWVYWQVFASAYASYVFNDISLDGNTFSDSHSIEKVNEQGLLSVGVFMMYNSWGVAFATQRGNEQFEGQESTSKYGSVTISYHH
jgi:lipid A 3-O-deacylase